MRVKMMMRRLAHMFDWITISERTLFEDEIERLTTTLVNERVLLENRTEQLHECERNLEKECMITKQLMKDKRDW